MQRLVYAPKAFVYVKSNGGEILDLTRYVTAGTISRKINQVSTAEITLRNPNMIFTATNSNSLQVFTPMDPITIYLMRVKGRPVRVFTGFLDAVPFYEMYPGTITLNASCTLKKLLYTFFDPALPYTREFLTTYGWFPDPNGQGMFNPGALAQNLPNDKKNPRAQLTDGSIGNLLYATLKHIGNWDDANIYIENLPDGLVQRMVDLYKQFDESNKLAEQEWSGLMKDIIGTGAFGNGGSGTGSVGSTGEVKGLDKIIPAVEAAANKHNVPAKMILAIWWIETTMGQNLHTPGSQYYGWDQCSIGGGYAYGPWRWNSGHPKNEAEANDTGLAADAICAAAAGWANAVPSLRNDIHSWAMKTQGVNCGNNPLYCSEWASSVTQAEGWLSKYGGKNSSGGKSAGGKGTVGSQIGSTLGNAAGAIVRAGGGGSSKGATTGGKPKIYKPISANGQVSSPFGEHRSYEIHHGTDYAVPSGTACIAPCDGEITQWAGQGGAANFGGHGGMVQFRFTQDVGQIKAGTVIGWGHVVNIQVHPHQKVKGGDLIASSNHPAPHVHWIQRADDSQVDGDRDGWPLLQALQKGETSPTAGGASGSGGGGGGGGGAATTAQMYTIAKATAFATQLEWPSMEETIEAIGLQGQKSLMNDKPLMPFIQELTDASLRQFQSMPNGDFFAFYPDYFGEFNHRKPYWLIDDIEILQGGIRLSDDALATHVYVVGDTLPGASDMLNKLFSAGTINIFNMFGAQGVLNRNYTPPNNSSNPNASSGPGISPQADPNNTALANKEAAVQFLKRYGARPYYSPEPMIRSPFFEAFVAYQTFMLMWSRQFITTFTFTFMPELFPGGHVGFPDHNLQMYIDEVEHSWNYETGFTTQANLSAPAVMVGPNGKPIGDTPLPPNMMMALSAPSDAEAAGLLADATKGINLPNVGDLYGRT